MSCPLCDSHSTKLLYPAKTSKADDVYVVTKKIAQCHGNIVQCQDCKLAYVVDEHIITASEKAYVESPIDTVYESERNGRIKTNQAVLKYIKRYGPQRGRLLDVGCYTGLFVETAINVGFEAHGIEPSKVAVADANRRGLHTIVQGTVQNMETKYEDDFFDVITLFDVIEHVSNPLDTLSIVRRKLKPGGLLVVSTPNFSSLLSHIQKSRWHAVVLQHIYYFSKNNLTKLLQQLGLTVVASRSLTRYFSISFLLGTIINRFGVKRDFKHVLLKHVTIPVNLYDQLVIFSKKNQ